MTKQIDSALVDADANNPVVTADRAFEIVNRIALMATYLHANEAFTCFLGDFTIVLWRYPLAINIVVTWKPDNKDKEPVDEWHVIPRNERVPLYSILRKRLLELFSEVLFHG